MAHFVDVAVPLGVRKTFAYEVPPKLQGRAVIGARVLVPFGRRLITGFIVGQSAVAPEGDFRVRPLRDVIDGRPALPQELIELALWVAEAYFTPPGEVLRSLLPAGSIEAGERLVRLNPRLRDLLAGGLRPPGLHPREELILETLARDGAMSLQQLTALEGLHDASPWVESCAERGWVDIEDQVARARVREKTLLGIRALPADAAAVASLKGRQAALYRLLQAAEDVLGLQEALRGAGAGASVARALESRGLVAIAPMKVDRTPVDLSGSGTRKILVFTPAQHDAFERLRARIRDGGSARALLYGVTGSGKTEVYLRLISEVLAAGGNALLLVPEIGLTPMLTRIAAAHFPDQVALLHSGMSQGERFDQWSRIHAGQARLVVGTRSAVFAPIADLRLIVIDEEQDASYKQDESPCYHAREVAWQRLQRTRGLLLLGSATPSVETFHESREGGGIVRLTLPERIESRPLPEVTIVDMSVEFQRHGRKQVVSGELRAALEAALARGEQAIVLLNRRGYARSLLCRSCGNVFCCPDCSISMTYHQQEGLLLCHYCGAEAEVPSACGSCGGEYIYFVGIGTEQLEEILRGALPRARIARVDRDTTRRRGSLRKVLFDFAEHKLDLLVGTQMLAKGHDFPQVTLVGVLAADTGLAFPDFRSAERTFQLLTQVAGRAGRGRSPGRVVIQSFYPDHYALQFARRQDYGGFFEHEVEFRRLLGYPPFRGLVQILVHGKDAERCRRISAQVADELKASAARRGETGRVRVLGPAAAPIEKLRGEYRFQVLLKTVAGVERSPILQDAFARLGQRRVPLKCLHVDVDPLSLL